MAIDVLDSSAGADFWTELQVVYPNTTETVSVPWAPRFPPIIRKADGSDPPFSGLVLTKAVGTVPQGFYVKTSSGLSNYQLACPYQAFSELLSQDFSFSVYFTALAEVPEDAVVYRNGVLATGISSLPVDGSLWLVGLVNAETNPIVGIPVSQYIKAQDWISITEFGARNDLSKDAAPAFRAAAAKALQYPGMEVIVPYGAYLFDSTLGPVSGVASSPAVVLDGLQGFKIRGVGRPKIVCGPNQAQRNNSFFVFLCSATQAAAGNYSENGSISGLELVYARDPSLSGLVTGINLTSSDSMVITDIVFTGVDNSLGVTGTGGRGHLLERLEFSNIATAFDNSQYENVTFRKNVVVGGLHATTAFNHFYDSTTIANIRLRRPLSQVLGSGNIYTDNEVVGYGSAFSIRGMTDSWIQNNRVHDFTVNDATDRSLISAYTQDYEYSNLGVWTKNIVFDHNVIWNLQQSGTGALRAIYTNRFLGARPVTGCSVTNNIIHNVSGIGISSDNIADDYVFGNIVDASTVGTPYGKNVILVAAGTQAGYSPTISSSGGDIILDPGGTGHVRFGTIQNLTGTPTLTKAIPIADKTGVVRLLQVVETS